MVIERIDSPADVKNLPREQIDVLASEIRDLLVRTCAVNGGHLAPNLGVVELTLALHKVLDLPADKLVWDVSHQTYVHKILTGRRDRFGTIRKGGGISGFAMRSESPYDPFGAGHASTSVSSALGMALARDLMGGKENVVAVIGDGALTGGLAYEALNNAGALRTPFVVILNDNEMSIAPNVGSIASYLSVLRTKPFANLIRRTGKMMLKRMPLGQTAKKAIEGAEIGAMHFIGPSEKTAVIFEELGFRYIGPLDGHNYDVLVDALHTAKDFERPVLLHVRTVKGKGYEPAERDSRTFHGIGANAFEPSDGSKKSSPAGRPKFQDAFGDAMIAVAEKDPRIVGITAAMPDGTGLAKFGKRFPDRYFDVGIAEAHAVCFAAGLASSGFRPVCAIYSTFLQRAYDQVIHDVVVQGLPVLFCMDRAGFVGDDGPTHMGLYDIAYMRTLPGMTLMAPRCEAELLPMMQHALSLNAPAAIRYPRGSTSGKHEIPLAPLSHGKAEVLHWGSRVALIAYGTSVDIALDAYALLCHPERGADAVILSEATRSVAKSKDRNGAVTERAQRVEVPAEKALPTVINARFAKPLDEALLIELERDHTHIITLEEHSLAGGFGTAVAEFVSDRGLKLRVERIGVANVLVQHDSQDKQRGLFGLTGEAIAARVKAILAPASQSLPVR
jgi:1-deoxy-D-xylulose-5-phosphate synthase